MSDLGFQTPQCTLLPPVRNLIERAALAESFKGCDDYRIAWLPDMPIGPPLMKVPHKCGGKANKFGSPTTIAVRGIQFHMSAEPPAAHAVYCAACHHCKSLYLASAWDKTDTVENYATKLKGKT